MGYVIVEKGEASRAQVLSVGGQVQPTSQDTGLELNGAISATAKALQNGAEIREEKHIDSSVGGKGLLQSQVASLSTKFSGLQQFKHFAAAMEDVSSGIKTYHGVDDQIKVIELRSQGIEKVRRNAARGAVQHGRKLCKGDRGPVEPAARPAAQDDLLDRVASYFRIGQRLQLSHGSAGRRKVDQSSASAPRCNFCG